MFTRASVHRCVRGAAVVVVMAAAAACGRLHRGSAPEPALLYFSNESLDQADVYAVASGSDARRIGTVMAGRTDTLVVPSDFTARGANVRIIARIFARNLAPNTGSVTILPGDTYQVRLPPDEKLLSFVPAG